MYQILLPTDYSENSRNAIRYALEFFKGQPCTFTLLHVQKLSAFAMDDLISAAAGATIYESLIKKEKDRIQQFCEEMSDAYPEPSYYWQTRIDYDDFNDAVQQEVERSNIDLIVMGTNGASGAQEILFGSNTLQVIRKVTTPTLIIPEAYEFGTFESVVFSAESCKELKLPQADLFKALLKIHPAQLHLLKIKEEASVKKHDCGSCLIDALKETPFTSHNIHGVPYVHALNSYLQLVPTQMHALFLEPKTFFKRLMQGSNLDVLKQGTRVPLLVLHK